MFETLHDLEPGQILAAVEALERQGAFATLIDPSGVYILFSACPGHELNFFCVVPDDKGWAPAPLTVAQYNACTIWAQTAVPQLCKSWKQRYPHSTLKKQ